ncbi:MAG: aminoacyl-histidine dipeptidase [Bacteroidales bacterium]|nr:aminoacyl-histidine dipeptidase [Bacteroidales bacterium]
MSTKISDLEPKKLWKNFESLTQIPRPSKKEGKVVEFVREFGEKLGLETKMDDSGNVVIKKPATPGMEDRKTVILQGHLDMVPQKNNDKQFDFEKDPIEAYVDGDWVAANGTTLGADNGMGVAAALSVLESDNIEHPPIEALFTVDEETGMTGAFGLKKGFLEGDILINMDSEDEGELYIGCAGGMDTHIRFNYEEDTVPEVGKPFRIDISGLKGGHSGLDIHLGRGNAIKLLNRLMWNAERKFGLRLADFYSGDVRNAIPREGHAIVTVPGDKVNDFKKYVEEFQGIIKNELASVDPNVKVKVSETEMPNAVVDLETTQNLFNGLIGCPNGVLGVIADMPEVVETSTSTGVIRVENGQISITTLQRSSVDSTKEYVGNMIRGIFEMAGAKVEHAGAYPGWKPDVKSPILSVMKNVYNDMLDKEPPVKVIHAGLECGLISAVYPNLDLISFGPTIRFPHSPDEKVNIETVKKFYSFLLETLKNIPKK